MSFADIPADAKPRQVRNRQKRFVVELMAAIEKSIVDDINAGKVPEDWDGIELRGLIEDRATNAATFIHEKHNLKRFRAFKRELINRNL